MEEIVVALRETRRGASRMPPLTVVGGPPGVSRTSGVAADTANETAGSTDIAELRDREIERLLAENARLNKRIMFLLKSSGSNRRATRSSRPTAPQSRRIPM